MKNLTLSYITKKNVLHQIRQFKNSIFQFSHLPFSDIVSTDALGLIIEHSESSRECIFTPLVTLKAFIFQVLSTDGSCRQAVNHVLSERLYEGRSANSIQTGAYCKARNRLPEKPLKQAVESSGQALHQQAHKSWLWKGHNTRLSKPLTLFCRVCLNSIPYVFFKRKKSKETGFYTLISLTTKPTINSLDKSCEC